MKERINGADLKQMILSAAVRIEQNRQAINELNVFPVPDGDTGTNMSLTLNTAAVEIEKNDYTDISSCADAVASALLRGARGNSGVILSLLFRGFARSLKGKSDIDGLDFALALSEGVDTAYKAVMKPAEGTILTVSRVCSASAAQDASENPDMLYVLEATVGYASAALKETVHQNPVLEKAGVIDAGGMGFVIILQGMLDVLKGVEVRQGVRVEAETKVKNAADFSEYTAEDIKFAYCTEFIVERNNPKRYPEKLRAFLNSIGDSLVLVDDEEIIKVHVHTNNPGRALEEAIKYGMLLTVKVENMLKQHTEKVVEHNTSADSEPKTRVVKAPERRYGFVSVCSGDGISAVFKDLGVDNIISGGQTMNPSTQDILNQIDKTPSEMVFVFPNNKNIILAAEQCVPLSDKNVIVMPTKTIPQGIAAMLAFDPSLETEENREVMLNAISRVKSGQITYAARDSEYDGKKIREGDYLCMLENQLLGNSRDLGGLVKKLARDFAKGGASFITVFYGEGVTEEEAESLRVIFEKECKNAEISLLYGGQAIYYYLISAE